MDLQPAESLEGVRHGLLSGAASLARNAQRVVRCRAVLLWLSVLLGTLLLLLGSDMLLRREESGLRLLSLLAWLLSGSLAAVKLLRPAWRFSPTSLQVARWIERSRPELGERLSTAVELASLSAEETRYGSRGFRESVLRHWQAAGFVPNWHQYLETRSLWNSLAAMLASALLLAGVALRWPDETQLAMQRMVLPWAAHHWPRNDQLAFRNPPQVVAWGSDLQLEVIDRKLPAPEPIDLHFRSADDTSSRSVTVIPTTMVSDIAVGNLPAVQQAIEVRAVGGDDDTMPWHRIDVVQPPKLNKYSFVITPPDYAGQEAQELVGHHIQVLAGSQVKFVGQFSEPIDQAVVELLPAPANVPPSVDALRSEGMPAVEEAAQPVQATEWLAMLEPDGRTLTIGSAEGQAITATQSLAWQLLISTRDGLHIHQPDSWSLEVVPDAPPVASLQAAELLQLSAQATLPLAGRATDDLGLTEVVARLQIDGAEDSEPRRYPLWTAGEPSAGQLPSREQVLQANWDLSTGPPLVTGQRISIWLEARDTSGQVGRSQSQSFEIRPSDELLLAIQERQNQILHRVRGLVDSQRRNAQLAARTRQRMQVEQRVDREETDVLMNIAQVQRAIGKQLSGDAASIAAELERLGTLLIQNRLHESELAGEMQRLRSQVEELAAQPMQLASSAAQQAASLAQRSVAEQRAWEADLESSLADSEQAQNRALGSLESLLDRLARTEALQQVQRELAQILSQQNALRRDTDQLQLQRLSAENSEEHRPRRAALSSDQQGLARRLEHLLSRAQELQAAAGNDQQALQGQIARATQTLVEEYTTANMRRSIEEIQSDRFAAATATQQRVAQSLENALRHLGAGGSTQLGSLQSRADSMRESGAALGILSEAQSTLAQQLAHSAASETGTGNAAEQRQPQELAEQQAKLRQQTEQEAARAEQTGDASAASALRAAVDSQSAAQQHAEQGQLSPAAQAAQAAAQQLQQTAEQLAQRAAAIEQEIQQQQLIQLAAAVAHLRSQQAPLVEQFRDLGASEKDVEAAAREERHNQIRQTAARQEAIRQLLRDARAQSGKLPTFDWTLEQSEQAMSRTVAAAQRYRIQPEASEAARDALRWLDLVDDALRSQRVAQESVEPTAAEPTADPSQENSPQRPVPALTSLKLLRGLQVEINRQTELLPNEPSPARRSQKLQELANMQLLLGKQLNQLLGELAAAGETGAVP